MQAEAAVLSDWWRIKWEDVKINNQARSLSAGSVAKVYYIYVKHMSRCPAKGTNGHVRIV